MKKALLTITALLALSLLTASTLVADTMDWHDWSASFNNGIYHFDNTSSAGTITGTSQHAFANYPGPFGVPYEITQQNMFAQEFQINGTSGLGGSANFTFSNNYNWGSGGQMILGNIHNYYEYTLSAWDNNNNPINVNSWHVIKEFDSSAPGTSGYFSTSSTQMKPNADGVSEDFFVNDPHADNNGGQGGLLWIDGLKDVSRMQLTLTASDLGQNAQQVDFILFDVATPTPEPGTLVMLGSSALGIAGLLRKRFLV